MSSDENKPTRDSRGRWLEGYCPNPNGRPPNKPKIRENMADLRIFGNTFLDFTVNGEQVAMDRRSALLGKMYESAMKGSVTQQRFLYNELKKNDVQMAEARILYDRLLEEWYLDKANYHDPDTEVPQEIENRIIALGNVLHHYFPTEYPLVGISGKESSDDEEE